MASNQERLMMACVLRTVHTTLSLFNHFEDLSAKLQRTEYREYQKINFVLFDHTFNSDMYSTPPRTARISFEIIIFGLKMMVKSGLEFFNLKSYVPLQRYLLTCQANSAIMGRFFCTGQQQL